MNILRYLAPLLLICFAACNPRGKVETHKLPSGEMLVSESRLEGGGGLTGEYSRRASLSIRWGDSNRTEKIADWHDYLREYQSISLLSDSRSYRLIVGIYFFSRERHPEGSKWSQWHLGATPQLLNYIRAFLDRTQPTSYVKKQDSVEYIVVGVDKENSGHGWAIRPDGGALPYELFAFDFENNRLTAKLLEESRYLPRLLVYSSNSQGGWTLDEGLTDVANPPR